MTVAATGPATDPATDASVHAPGSDLRAAFRAGSHYAVPAARAALDGRCPQLPNGVAPPPLALALWPTVL
jgi:hypothetical protein